MSETRTKKVTRNVFFSIMQNLANLGITFIARVVFVHVLDASYLGINGLFSNIFGLLSMADLGMATAMMYHLYRPIAENDKKKISELIEFFKKIYTWIALAVFVMGMVLLPFLRFIINLDHDIPYLEGYYIVALLNVVITYLFVYRTTLVSADQKNYLLSKCIIIFKLIICAAQIAVLFISKNYLLYLIVALILNFLCNLYQNRIAIKEYPFLKEQAGQLDKAERKRIFKDIKALFIYKVSGTLQTNTDSILISMFVGTIFVGYYSNYTLISTNIVIFIGLIFNNLKASVGNVLFDKRTSMKDKAFLFDVFELINFWIVSFCSISYFVLSKGFMQICFGDEYVLDNIVVLAIVLNFYTVNIRQTIWVFRETTGIFEQTKYVTLVTAILNVGLSILMGYFWSLGGILIATIIARMAYAWWREPLVLFKEYFHSSVRPYIIRYLIRLAITMIIGTAVYVLCNIISISNVYLNFFVQCVICLLFPNIVLFAVYGKTDEFKYLIGKFKRKRKNVG